MSASAHRLDEASRSGGPDGATSPPAARWWSATAANCTRTPTGCSAPATTPTTRPTPRLKVRRDLPVGPLLCVTNGTTRERHWSPAAARAELRRTAAAPAVRRRFAHTSSGTPTPSNRLARSVLPIAIQRQLGHYMGDPLPANVTRQGPPKITTHNAGSMRLVGPRSLRDLPHIQHSDLGITSVYLQGIDNREIIETVHARRAPMIPVSASLRL
jgi:hypothetical protein